MNRNSLLVPYIIKPSHLSSKKWVAITPEGKKIHFGAKGYQDFTEHQDLLRKAAYIRRHEKNENWYRSGIDTAGFWARWLLWNQPTIEESAKDIERRFGIHILLTSSP